MSMIPCDLPEAAAARNGPKTSTRQVIQDYRLGLISSYNLKAKVTYTILEQLKSEVMHPVPLNLPEMCCETNHLDLEHCEQRYMLTGQMKSDIAIVDLQVETAEPFKLMGYCRFRISGLKWFPSDYRFFSSSVKKFLTIWDANELCKIDEITLSSEIINYNHSKHSSSLIAVTTAKHPPQLIDLRTGHVSSNLTDNSAGKSLDVTWSPTCEFSLASSNDRGSIKIWDTRSGATPVTLIRRSKPAVWLAFYPDGIRLATISESKENGLSVFNVMNKSRVFSLDVLGLTKSLSCPISFHFGFMFVFMPSKLWVLGDSPQQKYCHQFFKPQKCYAFRPSTFQLYSGNRHGLQRYNFASPDQTIMPHSPDINIDEFSY